MDLDKIRNMSDIELQTYLRTLSDKKKTVCFKCGEKNANYTVNIQNRKKIQQKKLCSLCDNCYIDFLGKIIMKKLNMKWLH